MKYIVPDGWRRLGPKEVIIAGDWISSERADRDGGSDELSEFSPCHACLGEVVQSVWGKNEAIIRRVIEDVTISKSKAFVPGMRYSTGYSIQSEGNTITITVDKSKKIVIIVK